MISSELSYFVGLFVNFHHFYFEVVPMTINKKLDQIDNDKGLSISQRKYIARPDNSFQR